MCDIYIAAIWPGPGTRLSTLIALSTGTPVYSAIIIVSYDSTPVQLEGFGNQAIH